MDPWYLDEMLQTDEGKRIYLPDEDIEAEVKMQALAGPELAPEVFGYVVRAGKTNYCGFAMKRGYHIDPVAYSTAQKVNIALSMQDCVFRLHGKGILHGDIKLLNVLLVSNDATDLKVMLCDFGSAMLNAEATEPMSATTNYTSPFRCREWVEHRRRLTLSVQDDLYALATTIWQLFSGCVPYSDVEDDLKTRIASGPGLDVQVVPEEAGLRDLSHAGQMPRKQGVLNLSQSINVVRRLFTYLFEPRSDPVRWYDALGRGAQDGIA